MLINEVFSRNGVKTLTEIITCDIVRAEKLEPTSSKKMSATLFIVDTNEDCILCPSTTCRKCLCEKLKCTILGDYPLATEKLGEWKILGVKGYSVKCLCSSSSSSSGSSRFSSSSSAKLQAITEPSPSAATKLTSARERPRS